MTCGNLGEPSEGNFGDPDQRVPSDRRKAGAAIAALQRAFTGRTKIWPG
jgi:hypothetical protein